MPKSIYKESIQAGPFSIHFCNTNTEMELKGHCHFAQLYFEFQTLGSVGFPSFEHTHAEIRAHLIEQTRRPFRNCTNEDVLRRLFDFFRSTELREVRKYSAEFRLVGMELYVRGVPDDIGHADSFTVYRIHE
jgi:hypothetical protein